MDTLGSCALIAAAAAGVMLPIQYRMAVTLPENAVEAWLDAITPRKQAQEIMANNLSDLCTNPVRRYVNSLRNDGARWRQPDPKAAESGGLVSGRS